MHCVCLNWELTKCVTFSSNIPTSRQHWMKMIRSAKRRKEFRCRMCREIITSLIFFLLLNFAKSWSGTGRQQYWWTYNFAYFIRAASSSSSCCSCSSHLVCYTARVTEYTFYWIKSSISEAEKYCNSTVDASATENFQCFSCLLLFAGKSLSEKSYSFVSIIMTRLTST